MWDWLVMCFRIFLSVVSVNSSKASAKHCIWSRFCLVVLHCYLHFENCPNFCFITLLPRGIWSLWVLSPLPPLSRAGTFVLCELTLKLLTCLKVRHLLLFSLINILLFKNVCGNCLILLVTAFPSDMFNRAGGGRQAPPSLQPIYIW